MFPKRFFGNGNGNRSALMLCGECHEDIEGIIPYSFRLTKEQYLELHACFLRGGDFETLSALVRKYERKKTSYKNDRSIVLLNVTNFARTNGGNQKIMNFNGEASRGGNGGNGNGKHFPVSKKNGFKEKVNQKVLR